MAPRCLLFVLLLSLPTPFLLLPHISASTPAPDVVDLDYLIKNTGGDAPADPAYIPYGQALFSDDSPQNPKPFDESHVVVLTAANFSSFLAVRRHVVVDFYVPWCSWSRKLAPEYAGAASHLAHKEIDIALAKVDVTKNNGLAHAHGIQGYPTVLFFIDGVSRYTYYGERTKDAIAAWITRKLEGVVQNVTTVEEAEKIVTGFYVAVLAFLDSLSGAHRDELVDASKLDDTINFYQTTSPHVAKLFQIDPEAKRPFVVLLETDPEGKLTVSQYKHPGLSDLFLNHSLM